MEVVAGFGFILFLLLETESKSHSQTTVLVTTTHQSPDQSLVALGTDFNYIAIKNSVQKWLFFCSDVYTTKNQNQHVCSQQFFQNHQIIEQKKIVVSN